MRCRLVLVVVAAAVAALVVPAQAAPRAEGPYTAPFDSASQSTYVDCAPGATCTPTAAATSGGSAASAVSYARSEAAAGVESLSGHSSLKQAIRLPHKAEAATITLVWRVANATSDARSSKGTVFAGTYLWGRAFCNGCVNTYVSEVVTYCGAGVLGQCAPTQTTTASEAVHTLTVTVSDVRGHVTVESGASAYAGARRMCMVGIDGCQLDSPDPTHAGTASSAINATLESISVARA